MRTLSRAKLFFSIILAAAFTANFVQASEKIDINSAPLEDLVKIIHIGEARAKELISLRPFSSIDELVKIKGIGTSRIDDIKKQDLALIDEAQRAEPQITETKPLPDRNLATLKKTIETKTAESSLQTTNPSLFLIAAAIAVFSGTIILLLKKKLKIG